MRRRSAWYLAAILVLLVVGAGTIGTLMVRHVPTFYRQSELPDLEVRECRSTECWRLTQDMWNTIENGLPWKQEFTQDQLNGYLQHACDRSSAAMFESSSTTNVLP